MDEEVYMTQGGEGQGQDLMDEGDTSDEEDGDGYE
jgi:hypothetical protein